MSSNSAPSTSLPAESGNIMFTQVYGRIYGYAQSDKHLMVLLLHRASFQTIGLAAGVNVSDNRRTVLGPQIFSSYRSTVPDFGNMNCAWDR